MLTTLDQMTAPVPNAGNGSIAAPEAPHPPKGAPLPKRKQGNFERVCCSFMSLPLRCILCASSGSFLFGFNISLLNTSINVIAREFKWCDIEADADCNNATLLKAFISTAVFIGAAAGAMTSGRFLSLGRRMLLLLCMVVFIVGIISSVTSNSFSALLWSRLIVGYGVGVVSFVVPTYMAEMSPKDKRGSYGVLHQLFITVGIFIAVLIGLPFALAPGSEDPDYLTWEVRTFDKIWWRVMLGLGIFPVMLTVFLLLCCFTFETPHYYVENHRPYEAEALLKELSNTDDVSDQLDEITKSIREGEEAKEAGLSLKAALAIPVYRHVIFVGCLLSAFQQFGGINVFMASSNKLFGDAGLEPKLVTIMSTILTLVNMLMTFPSIFLIEKLGRKTLMLMGCFGMFIGTVPGAIALWVNQDALWATWVACGGAILFVVCFAVTYGPVLWVYLFEIYPIEIKGVASGLATAVNWVAGIAMVFVSNFIATRVNYTIFAAMSLVATALVAIFMRETKGRSLEDSPFMVDKNGQPILATKARNQV